jgi:hypothetical protein
VIIAVWNKLDTILKQFSLYIVAAVLSKPFYCCQIIPYAPRNTILLSSWATTCRFSIILTNVNTGEEVVDFALEEKRRLHLLCHKRDLDGARNLGRTCCNTLPH